MIVHSPSVTQTSTEIQISARIESQIPRPGYPSDLWFRFRKSPEGTSEREFVEGFSKGFHDPDPFVVCLLLVAMQWNENLIVRGAISEKLLAGLNAYQRIYNSWFPERFKIIKIIPDALRPASSLNPPQTEACAFSGGVDSFYTFLQLREQSSLTHAVFMAGFDMPLNLKSSIRELTESYTDLMKQLEVTLIVGSTNARNFVNAVDWTNSHGQVLAATALLLRKRCRKFYIPASYTGKTYPKWGTHPDLDPLLSTEDLQFEHHGSHVNRIQKLVTLVQVPETYPRLRVCWIQDIGLKNCGNCEKCARTMTALKILGKLENYTNFPSPPNPLNPNQHPLSSHHLRTHQARLFASELLWAALIRGKLSIAWSIFSSLAQREFFYRISRKIKKKSL